MNTQRKVGLIAAALALGGVLGLLRHVLFGPSFEDARAFVGVTNLVFTGRTEQDQRLQMNVADPGELTRIVSLIRLQEKGACLCLHSYEAVFQKPSGEIRASFCSHCFDVLDPRHPNSDEGTRYYRMPKEFYAEFQRLAQAQTTGKWNVPGR
jgi:hypothetical protein